jgi:hypothetical protein
MGWIVLAAAGACLGAEEKAAASGETLGVPSVLHIINPKGGRTRDATIVGVRVLAAF